MKILAIDTSAGPSSAAVLDGETLLVEFFLNTRQTHSQTLLTLVDGVLRCTQTELGEIGLFAVSAGPGSFTGVRIGVSCVKGLAFPRGTLCAGVSTLEAMAWNFYGIPGTVCAVMDARCGQVYNAVFASGEDGFCRLTEDRALSMEALAQECRAYPGPLYLVGDGALLCHQQENFQALGAKLPPQPARFQRAAGVAMAALRMQREGSAVPPERLMPVYLRLPQAERELRQRLAGK